MPKKKRLAIVFALLLAVILLIASVNLQPRFMTVVALSRVEIEGVGWEDGEHRWRDDYWLLYATTDTLTELKLIKWNEDEAQKPTVQNQVVEEGETKTVVPKSNIEIRIYPKQPYYSVQLEWRRVQVYPKTWGTYRNKITGLYGKLDDPAIGELKASFWVLSGGWAYDLHTPYTAELWKDGTRLDEVVDDSLGGKNAILLQDTETGQTVKVENFGKGEYGYNPPVHDELLLFGSNYILETTDALQAIKYIEYDKVDMSFSNYWFGGGDIYKDHAGHWVMRYPDGSPLHLASYSPDKKLALYMVADGDFPGQKRDDSFWDYEADPESAHETRDRSNTKPYGLSLVNYLNQKCGLKSFNFLNNPSIPWCREVKIENNVLKLTMPAGSAYSDIKVIIPTELADSIVLVEYYPTAEIAAAWSTGAADPEIGDKLKALVSVKNTAFNLQTGEGFGGTLITKAYFEYGGEVGGIAPVQFTEFFEKAEDKTYEFMIHNTGAGNDTEFKLVFEVWNEKPELCGTATLKGKFLKVQEISTIVTVYTRDASTTNPISGILVSMSWDSESDSGYSIGGAAVFDLEYIETDISLVAIDPAENYLPAETTGHVKGGENVFYLDMEPVEKTSEEEEEDSSWLVWVVVAVAVVIAVSVVYKKRRVIKSWV